MYKMKEVCQLTGLTEKAIRIYMDQKLVEPKIEEGIHRKAYYFMEKDIERLKDISALRGAGFSIAEIKQMLECTANIPLLVEEKETVIAAEIRQRLDVQEALKHLTIQEHSDVTKLADAVKPRSTYAKETPRKRMSRKKKWLILLMIAGIILRLIYGVAGIAGVLIQLSSVGLVFGIIAVIFAIRYAMCSRQDRKRECCGIGKITAIVENGKVEEYIGVQERNTFQNIIAYLVFGMFGEGLWDMLRPDCWYPVISYQPKEEQVHLATVRYGCFKSDWKIGESVEIAWEEDREQLVYICNGQALRKKAFAYFMLGLLLLGMSEISIIQLFDKKENNLQTSATAEMQGLRYPENADCVIVEQDGKCYELNEEEKDVLRLLFQEAKSGEGEYYYSVNFGEGMASVHFYQGEEEIETFTAGNFSYILTGDYMLYMVMPIQIEYNGTQLGDTNYIAGFLNRFAAKVRQRHLTAEILDSISDEEHLKDFRLLLENAENFDGTYDKQDSWQFLLSKTGYETCFGVPEGESERGELEIILQDGKFTAAKLMQYRYNEIGETEILSQKDWQIY